jgi:hypothetical protein
MTMVIVAAFFVTKHPQKKTTTHCRQFLIFQQREKGDNFVIITFFITKQP